MELFTFYICSSGKPKSLSVFLAGLIDVILLSIDVSPIFIGVFQLSIDVNRSSIDIRIKSYVLPPEGAHTAQSHQAFFHFETLKNPFF